MWKRLVLALVAASLTAVGSNRVIACEGDKVLLDEDFSFPNLAWNYSKRAEIKDGAVFVRPETEHSYRFLNQAFLFTNADICLTVTAQEVSKPENSYGGLLFWAPDLANAHLLLIASNGYFTMKRLVQNEFVPPPLDWAPSDFIVQGVDKPNKIRLTIKDDLLSIAINDKVVGKLRGQSPGAPSLIGLIAASSDKIDTWKFSALKITNLKEAPPQ